MALHDWSASRWPATACFSRLACFPNSHASPPVCRFLGLEPTAAPSAGGSLQLKESPPGVSASSQPCKGAAAATQSIALHPSMPGLALTACHQPRSCAAAPALPNPSTLYMAPCSHSDCRFGIPCVACRLAPCASKPRSIKPWSSLCARMPRGGQHLERKAYVCWGAMAAARVAALRRCCCPASPGAAAQLLTTPHPLRPPARSIADIVAQRGFGDGKQWLKGWEKVWQATLNTCTLEGNCTIRLV